MSKNNFVLIDDDEDDNDFDDSNKTSPSNPTLLNSNLPPFNSNISTSNYAKNKSSLITTPFTSPPNPSTFTTPYSSMSYKKSHTPIKMNSPSPASNTYVGVDLGSKSDHLLMKEELLRRKEAELAARERHLEQQEEYLSKVGVSGKPPNWPRFYPLVHHNIEEDIPEQHQRIVKKVYYLWLATEALLLWNMIACLTILIAHPATMSNTAADFGVAFVYVFTMTAGSFWLWHRPCYLAFSKNSSFFYFIFFIFISCHVLFCYYMAVGIPGSGAAGFINALGALTGGAVGTFAICLIALAGWIMVGTYSLWTFREVYACYTAGGHSFEKAKSEAIQIGVSNSTVQGAATSYFNNSTNV